MSLANVLHDLLAGLALAAVHLLRLLVDIRDVTAGDGEDELREVPVQFPDERDDEGALFGGEPLQRQGGGDLAQGQRGVHLVRVVAVVLHLVGGEQDGEDQVVDDAGTLGGGGVVERGVVGVGGHGRVSVVGVGLAVKEVDQFCGIEHQVAIFVGEPFGLAVLVCEVTKTICDQLCFGAGHGRIVSGCWFLSRGQ